LVIFDKSVLTSYQRSLINVKKLIFKNNASLNINEYYPGIFTNQRQPFKFKKNEPMRDYRITNQCVATKNQNYEKNTNNDINDDTIYIYIPKISSENLFNEALLIKKQKYNASHLFVSSETVARFSITSFIQNIQCSLSLNHKRNIYAVANVVGKIYDLFPPQFLAENPPLNQFFFYIFDLANTPNNFIINNQCWYHKASQYVKHLALGNVETKTNIFDILLYVKHGSEKHWPTRSHSEYFAAKLNLPLIIVKRGTIDNIIHRFFTQFQNLIRMGKASDIMHGWQEFLSLPTERIITHFSLLTKNEKCQISDQRKEIERVKKRKRNSQDNNYNSFNTDDNNSCAVTTEVVNTFSGSQAKRKKNNRSNETEALRVQKTVFTPTTHFLFNNDLRKVLNDVEDKRGSLCSEVAARFFFNISYAFGDGYTNGLFIPKSRANLLSNNKTPYNDNNNKENNDCNNGDKKNIVSTLKKREKNKNYLVQNSFTTEQMYFTSLELIRQFENETTNNNDNNLIQLIQEDDCNNPCCQCMYIHNAAKNIYNRHTKKSDTVILSSKNKLSTFQSKLRSKKKVPYSKVEVPVFCVMLLEELCTIIMFCKKLVGLTINDLIGSIEKEVVFTSHHLSKGFLCPGVIENCLSIYQKLYMLTDSYRYYLSDNFNYYYMALSNRNYSENLANIIQFEINYYTNKTDNMFAYKENVWQYNSKKKRTNYKHLINKINLQNILLELI